jgi:hypothetical protein
MPKLAALSGAQVFSQIALPLPSQPWVIESPRKTSWAAPCFEIALKESWRFSVPGWRTGWRA